MLAAAASRSSACTSAPSGVTTLPNTLPSKQGYLALQRTFPAQNPYPAEIVVAGRKQHRVAADLASCRRQLAADPRFGPGTIQTAPRAHVSRARRCPSAATRSAAAAVAAVRDLRSHVLPAAFAGTGARVYVGGKTAENADYFDAVTQPDPVRARLRARAQLDPAHDRLPLARGRARLDPAQPALGRRRVRAAHPRLPATATAPGCFGFQHVHAIDAWVPLFLFSVLFGLSMDYQVFLMSRIKERYDQSGSTRDAVASGVASTARIITGAALIIVVVFAGFARGQLVMFQQMGFGVAVALLLDATIIRSVVLPSTLACSTSAAGTCPLARLAPPRRGRARTGVDGRRCGTYRPDRDLG